MEYNGYITENLSPMIEINDIRENIAQTKANGDLFKTL